jgi:hypothetical protein
VTAIYQAQGASSVGAAAAFVGQERVVDAKFAAEASKMLRFAFPPKEECAPL